MLISSSDKREFGQGREPGPGGPDPGKDDEKFASNMPDSPEGLHLTPMAPRGQPRRRQGHGFAQTDTVKHCPFCGSGDVWGGSDGTITCEFDGATFQVSVEPEYPSAPGNMNGQPLNIDGEPDDYGQAEADDAWAPPANLSPSSGEDLEAGEEGEDDEDEEGPAQDEGAGGGFPFQSSYRTFAGDRLSEPLYLKHLAIRHAEDPDLILAGMRTAARKPKPAPEPEEPDIWSYENPRCPDYWAHYENAADRLYPGEHTRELTPEQDRAVLDEAHKEYRACDGHY